jgi:hypothetical protein
MVISDAVIFIFSPSRYWDWSGFTNCGQDIQYRCTIYAAKLFDRLKNPARGNPLSFYPREWNKKVEFVKSNENDSGIISKNVDHKMYEKHAKKYLENLESGWRFKIGRILEVSLTLISVCQR